LYTYPRLFVFSSSPAHRTLHSFPTRRSSDLYFFACRSIQEALNTLLIAVTNGEGFIKITGEVGTGKTLLCRKFLSTLGPNWVSADRKSTRLNSSHVKISYAVFCLKKKTHQPS